MPLSFVIILILALVAVIGWLRAWRLSGKGAPQAAAELRDGNVAAAQRLAEDQIAASIQRASELFQKNLTVQALKINDELESLAGRRLRQQVEDFASVLDGLTTTASASVAQLESLIDARRQALEASMATAVVDEKQRAIERFYASLGDLVAGYIIQTLGNDIDVSSQLPFVTRVLEENQEQIKQDLLRDY